MKRIEIDTARGKKRVPPGQYLVGDRFPILTYGPTPKFNADIWTFKVSGLVENPLQFTWEKWNELPNVEVKADMHCVIPHPVEHSREAISGIWVPMVPRGLSS